MGDMNRCEVRRAGGHSFGGLLETRGLVWSRVARWLQVALGASALLACSASEQASSDDGAVGSLSQAVSILPLAVWHGNSSHGRIDRYTADDVELYDTFSAFDLAAGDTNGDGVAELAFTLPGASVSFWSADGVPLPPPYPGPELVPPGQYPRIALGNLIGDATAEFVSANGPLNDLGQIRVFDSIAGDVTDSFLPNGAAYLTDNDVAICDLNNDGLGELVIAGAPFQIHGAVDDPFFTSTPGSSDYFQGNPPNYYAGVNNHSRMTCADLDGDGHDEIIISDWPGQCLQIRSYPGKPAVVFPGPTQEYCIESDPSTDLAAGDLNDDGVAEIITGMPGGNILIHAHSEYPLDPGEFGHLSLSTYSWNDPLAVARDFGCVPGSTSACTANVGAPPCDAVPGTRTCSAAGTYSACVMTVNFTPELGNGIDDDCDSIVDECNPGQTSLTCTATVGTPGCPVTAPGTASCGGGGCVPLSDGTVPELANGIDDDCDGEVDECDGQASLSCAENVPGCGTVAGVVACDGSDHASGECVLMGDGNPETANGLDDDCDGQIDECDGQPELTCLVDRPTCGGLIDGTSACTGDTSAGECIPTVWDVPDDGCDGEDNDCDGLIDEDMPANTGQCTPGEDVVFHVDLNDDGLDADAEAANCIPANEGSTGTCRLRGVFRRAEQLACMGCRVVADLNASIYHTDDELRLTRGNLLLRGQSSEETIITTTSSCADAACSSLDCPDVGCGPECGRIGTHRLIDARADEGHAPFLELQSLTLRGGRNESIGSAEPSSAAGGVVLTGGGLVLDDAVVRDNRARGWGVGVTVAYAQFLTVTDSVIRDNMNEQAVENNSCHAGGIAGGLTAMGGGLYARAGSVEITRSAIIRNMASDGGGAAIIASDAVSVSNSTFSQNEAAGRAGGMRVYGGHVNLEFNSFIGNSAGGGSATCADCELGAGIDVQAGADHPTLFSAFGNVLAENALHECSDCTPHSPDCAIEPDVDVEGAGFNLIGSGDLDCLALGDPATDPLIGVPGDEITAGALPVPASGIITSSTQLNALQSDSLAVGAYPSDALLPAGAPPCAVTDQRTFIRPQAGPCSLGAYEYAAVPDSDGDGIPDELDPAPLAFSAAFNDAGLFGQTVGEIATRGDQLVVVHNLEEPEGVIVEAIEAGGSAPAEIIACGGSVQITLAAGEWQAITCPRPTSCVFSAERLTVYDRADVVADVFGDGFTVWHDGAIDGDVYSLAGGQLLAGATISGDATLVGVLGGNRAGVMGTLFETASVAPQALLVRPILSVGTDSEVPYGGTLAVGPGNYGNVVVRPNGKLVLTAPGVYRFASLVFDPDAELDTTALVGRTVIAVQHNLTLGDRFELMGNEYSTVDIYSNSAAVEIGHDSVIAANLEAPFADIQVHDRAQFSGCLGGRVVTIGHDADVGVGVLLAPSPISATLTVTGDWGGDYCVTIDVTNHGTSPTGWGVALATNQSTIYNTWNGGFSGTSGNVTVTPNKPWNQTLLPGQTDSSVGFCGHRHVPGAMASVLEANAQ